MTEPEDVSRAWLNHVENRTIVLEELKLLYVPVPKSAWTSVLWLLTELMHLPPARFAHSIKPEVASHMLVHDYAIWAQERRRLRDLSPEVRERALTEDDWFRFTIVREPGGKLWSGWQSKILLREPVYAGFHATDSWFPAPPSDADEVLADFHAFVEALAAGWTTNTKMRDPHWGRQYDVASQLPLTHIGRLEDVGATVDALRAHVARFTDATVELRHENALQIGYDPVVYDEKSAATVRELFAQDFSAYGYPPITGNADPAALERWRVKAEPKFTAMRELISRHDRIAVLAAEARRRQQTADTEIKELRRTVKAGEKELTAQRSRVEKLQRRLDRLESSFSWRATAPLRAVRARVGRRRGAR